MAEYTTNYNLIKPAQTDFFNVDDLNENADKIDAALKTNADGISAANTAIGTNAAAIAENSTAITGNTAAIGQNTSDIATNTTAIGQNASNIAANTTAIGQCVKYTDSLTLEEIIASTDLTGKVASASAAKSLKESLSTIDYSTQIVKNADTNPVVLKIYKTGRLVTLEYVGGSLTHVMNEVLFTIPTDCRPELGLYIYANANSNATGYGASVNIKQNGEVAALPQNTSSAHRLCFTVTYVSAS